MSKTKKHARRTPDQIIADLEAEIARVKARAAAKQAKRAPGGKAFMVAVKSVDKAIEAATQSKNDGMKHALETARAALGEHMVEMGIRVPQKRRRGPRKLGAA